MWMLDVESGDDMATMLGRRLLCYGFSLGTVMGIDWRSVHVLSFTSP